MAGEACTGRSRSCSQSFLPFLASKQVTVPPLVTVKTSSPLLTGLVMSGTLSSADQARWVLVTSPAPLGRSATSLDEGLMAMTRPAAKIGEGTTSVSNKFARQNSLPSANE